MAHKLPRLKADEITRILEQHGFVLISQRGSHQKWRHYEAGKGSVPHIPMFVQW